MSRILLFFLHLPLASTLCSLLGIRLVSPAWLPSSTLMHGPFFRHALSTPVTVLSGCIDASLRSAGTNTQLLQQAKVACQSIESILYALSEDCSRDRDVIPIVSASVEAVRACQILQPDASLSSHISCEETLQLRGNSLQWQEALNCVITNAIEAYSPSENFKPVIVLIYQTKKSVQLEVIDYAKGMSSVEQLFVRVPGITAKSTGTGIGLAFVQHVVEQQLGGKFEIESRPGKGTRVRWIFPTIMLNTDTQIHALS